MGALSTVQPQQPQIPEPPVPQSQGKKVWVLILLGVFLLSCIGGIFFFLSQQKQITPLATHEKESQLPQATPTPMPFHEITIPYLRKQTYRSSLGSLERVAQNAGYTSYLTSYTSEGLQINGLLTVPTGEEPILGWPAVVFIHGYIPPAQYQTQGQYADYVDYLARNGFVVFKIDLRSHGDSEGEPGGAYYSADYITDTLNAYKALQATDFVNPEAIGLWGHSMAGNVVMRSLATMPEIPAAVIWAGAVYTYEDMREFGIQDSSYSPPQTSTQRQNRRQRLSEIHGDPSENSLFWQQLAPVTYLGDLQGAIQLNHAINDDVVSIEYSRNLDALLDKTTVPHELHEYPSGGHNMNGVAFTQAMQNTVEFYKKYLAGKQEVAIR